MLVLPQTTKKYGPRDAHTDEGGGQALMAESEYPHMLASPG